MDAAGDGDGAAADGSGGGGHPRQPPARFDINRVQQYVEDGNWDRLESYFTEHMRHTETQHPYLWLLCRRSVLLSLGNDDASKYYQEKVLILKGLQNDFTNTAKLDKMIKDISDHLEGKKVLNVERREVLVAIKDYMSLYLKELFEHTGKKRAHGKFRAFVYSLPEEKLYRCLMCQKVFGMRPNQFFPGHLDKCENVTLNVENRCRPLVGLGKVTDADRQRKQVHAPNDVVDGSGMKRSYFMSRKEVDIAANSIMEGKGTASTINSERNMDLAKLFNQARKLTLDLGEMHDDRSRFALAQSELYQVIRKIEGMTLWQDNTSSGQTPQSERQVRRNLGLQSTSNDWDSSQQSYSSLPMETQGQHLQPQIMGNWGLGSSSSQLGETPWHLGKQTQQLGWDFEQQPSSSHSWEMSGQFSGHSWGMPVQSQFSGHSWGMPAQSQSSDHSWGMPAQSQSSGHSWAMPEQTGQQKQWTDHVHLGPSAAVNPEMTLNEAPLMSMQAPSNPSSGTSTTHMNLGVSLPLAMYDHQAEAPAAASEQGAYTPTAMLVQQTEAPAAAAQQGVYPPTAPTIEASSSQHGVYFLDEQWNMDDLFDPDEMVSLLSDDLNPQGADAETVPAPQADQAASHATDDQSPDSLHEQ